MFLEDYAPYLWTMGLFFLVVSMYFFLAKNRGSQKLLLANTGILVAGVPFFKSLSPVFLVSGASIVAFSVLLYLSEKNLLQKILSKN